MAVGVIARCDAGGLSSQTFDLVRHLRPEHVLLVDLPDGKCRGRRWPGRYDDCGAHIETVHDDVIDRATLERFADRIDTLLTVECLYAPSEVWHAVNERCRTVCVANPELFVDAHPTSVVLPTSWEADRIPGAVVLPHPVDLANVYGEVGRSVSTFLHVEAPAMLDRNGSQIVAAALARVTRPCTLIVRSYQPKSSSDVWRHVGDRVGRVRVVWDDRCTRDWWDSYPDTADVLLLPRRYGGLSLVVQEAAAFGIPPVMLDIDPQRGENWPGWRIAGLSRGSAPMRGGMFPVYDGDPVALAHVMDQLIDGTLDVAAESTRALAWARSRSWGQLGPAWHNLLA